MTPIPTLHATRPATFMRGSPSPVRGACRAAVFLGCLLAVAFLALPDICLARQHAAASSVRAAASGPVPSGELARAEAETSDAETARDAARSALRETGATGAPAVRSIELLGTAGAVLVVASLYVGGTLLVMQGGWPPDVRPDSPPPPAAVSSMAARQGKE
ncbi:MAG: hypothetical protein ACI364_06855 [Coriobacteriales bacterium]